MSTKSQVGRVGGGVAIVVVLVLALAVGGNGSRGYSLAGSRPVAPIAKRTMHVPQHILSLHHMTLSVLIKAQCEGDYH